eukprot:TRINITY_DN116_c0_g1_i13.p1 TRINITY_DN116_c0_g1~~TRINITY_DN116_c0_g1_i13.p1  ORF type:complete len:146 (+),score=21.88 TRINITY_DN116_c0_g1_i13:74-511(+)
MFGQSASLFGSQLGGFISGVANKIKEQIAVSHEEFMREREKYDNPDAVAAPASPTVPIWTHMAAGDKDLEAKLREHALIIACVGLSSCTLFWTSICSLSLSFTHLFMISSLIFSSIPCYRRNPLFLKALHQARSLILTWKRVCLS